MLTEEQLINISEDVSEEIAKEAVRRYSTRFFGTQDELTNYYEITKAVAKARIVEVFTGFAAK